MDDRTAPPNPGPEAARGVARALGIAWVGATLYEDPLLQEAFVRSAATLASLATDLPPILVSASTLHLGARDLGGDDVSIKPLAQSCFVHGCAALRLGPEITAPDLAAFLEVVRLPPEVVAQEGGLAAALTRRRIGGVSADPRIDAGSGDDELRVGDDPLGWSAESLACVLRSVAAGDLAPTLLEGFARAVTLPAVADRQVAVAAHIEALMTFPPSVQATVLDWVFETDPGLADTIFAHLASHELDRLARSLGPIGHERASAALAGRGDDHSPLRSVGSADPPELGAAGEVPPTEEWWDGLPHVMETLLSSSFVRAAPHQVVEAWARGFDALLIGGRFGVADAWYELALGVEDPTLRVLLDGRRHHLPGPDALRSLLGAVGDFHASRLFTRLLENVPDHLFVVLGGFDADALDVAVDRVGELLAGDVERILDHAPSAGRPLEVCLRIAGAAGGDLGDDNRILGYLYDDSPGVVVAAIDAAGKRIAPRTLAGLLHHPSADVRDAAVGAFEVRSGPAVNALAHEISGLEMDPRTLEAAARALVRMPRGRAALDDVASNSQLLLSSRGRAFRRKFREIAKEAR